MKKRVTNLTDLEFEKKFRDLKNIFDDFGIIKFK